MTSTPRTARRLRLLRGGATPAAKPDVPAEPRAPAELPFDDHQLLAAVLAADRTAAAAFHDRVRPQVERTVRRLLGPGDRDRQDLTQTALIEIVTTIGRYRGECSLDTWTATVTARVIYKSIRRRKLERGTFAQLPSDDVISLFPSSTRPARDIAVKDLVARVMTHVAAIDPVRSWAFLLHDVWGYDLKETAQILDVSVSAAQSRLVRGRREVHARIAEDTELAHAMNELEDRP